MLKLTPEQAQTLRTATEQARPDAALEAAVARLYADVQQAIDARQPRCDASGRCCRFESFGHRLFITTAELAYFVNRLDRPLPAGWDGTGCPFQTSRLCDVHTIRPFGCRIFFCDATADDWQHEQYERFHLRLRQLHEQHGVPYLYVEWREALRAVLTPVETAPLSE